MSFHCTHFKYQTILFDPLLGTSQILPLRVIVDLGALAVKGYFAFSKAPAIQKPHHQIALCHTQDTRWRGSYTFAEVYFVYNPVPAD